MTPRNRFLAAAFSPLALNRRDRPARGAESSRPDLERHGRGSARFVLPVLCAAAGWLFLAAGAADFALAEEPGFSYANVVARAKDLAAHPFKDTKGEIPPFLTNIGYDNWRDIRFNTQRSLWREDNLLFTAQFFFPGLYFDRTVAINTVEGSRSKKFPFSPELFNYGQNRFNRGDLKKLGYAGFRLHYPLNNLNYCDEIAVFLGASYFRALARGQVYGLSARGLALDTVLPSGEEFPYFREFWLVKPAPSSSEITMYVLLDSASVAGAYRFVIKPERTVLYEKSLGSGHPNEMVPPPKETRMDVDLTLYFRRPVQKVGIAPLTSMFCYGENDSIRPIDDFRPEIHDSDGLLVNFDSGEWLWRPLVNPKGFQINTYNTQNPKGFGLLQRDTDFDHYQDLETHYERRPSLWIVPTGPWGEGRIELDQIPVGHEISDNVVAYWVPARPAAPGEPMTFSYSMLWSFAERIDHHGGQVVATRTGEGKTIGSTVAANELYRRKFVVDFEGGRLSSLSETDPVTPVVGVGEPAAFLEAQVLKNRITNGWRLVFLIDTAKMNGASEVAPVELRAFLKLGDDVLTETWNYTYLHRPGSP